MGPLVPDIISGELNFIVALVIGILFGVILEQAGFSTSKKLVGLFYGYDFTVLRVFFTAGFVAMIGVIILDHFGLLDINLIYINPAYIGPAVVGGIIMGLGFVIGGFCPGTSICASAIGKIDAMYFVAGTVLGILLFAEGYPLWEGFFKSGYIGAPRMFESLGISQSLFAFLLTAIALASFWIASIVENKVNGVKKPALRFTPYYVALAAVGVIVALSAFVFPPRKTYYLEKVENTAFVNSYPVKEMTIDEFAIRIVNNDKKMVIIDFRPNEEYKKESLPNSIPYKVDNFFEKESNRFLRIRKRTYVFTAENEYTERKLAVLASELGYKNIKILKGGLNAFKKNILNFEQSRKPENKIEEATFKFRKIAKVIIPKLIKAHKNVSPVKKKLKRVVGGC
jgi:rhodanese-related sulfurtransferase/uncharacterized membrane protein YedE/YeeE